MPFRDLATKRLILRGISPDDRDMVFRLFSNAEVNRYLFDTEPISDLHGADEIVQSYLQPEPRLQHRWILVKKTDGAKIGTCGFHCWDKSEGSCEVGYDLFPDFWGMGYMQEAMQAILAFARNEMDIKQVNACIYPENHASIKLADKLGFIFTGQMKDEIFRGQTYPHRIYTLVFPEE